jgi:glycosyltransferase involved in cell wall biosynthesis
MTNTSHANDKVQVVVFIKHFAPGFKIGGPLQSVLGLLAFFTDMLSASVITLNRDYTERDPYPHIETGSWTNFGTARVMYMPGSIDALRKLMIEFPRGSKKTLYLQTFFSPMWSLLPLILVRVGLIHPQRIVLAPRGEMSDGALSIRPFKKRVYMRVARVFGLHRRVIFQATSAEERDEIKVRLAVAGDRVVLFKNLPAIVPRLIAPQQSKVTGDLRMVFFSRISPKKNLHLILEEMGRLSKGITLDIYGPSDDDKYLAQCTAIVEHAGLEARVSFLGAATRDQLGSIFPKYDVFVLPTKGENFGHAVYEALAHGLPVIISDRTPWKSLWRDRAGQEVTLDQQDALRNAILGFADMNQDVMAEFRAGAANVAQRYINDAVDRRVFSTLFVGA